MTRPSVRWRALMCGVAIALGVTACTSSSADGPSTSTSGITPSASVVDPSTATSDATVSSPSASPTPSVIDVPTPSSQPPTSLDPAAQEAADRAAVEAAWAEFWVVYQNIVRTPPEQREPFLSRVSVDPMKTKILNAATDFDAKGLDYYGAVIQHPYWIDSIAGGELAVMRDCQDQSNYGSVYIATGEKRTVGVERDSLQAGFIRSPDGTWKVQNVQFLENVPC